MMTFPFKRSPSSPRIPESTLSHEKDRFLANALGVTVIPAILIGNGTAVDGSIELVSYRDDPPAGPFWLARSGSLLVSMESTMDPSVMGRGRFTRILGRFDHHENPGSNHQDNKTETCICSRR
jgi:hypothetical protein